MIHTQILIHKSYIISNKEKEDKEMSSNKVIWVLMLTLVVLATISQAICPDGNYGQPCNGFDKTCCDKSLVCNGGLVGTCLCRNGNILNCDKPKKCKTFSEKCNGFDKKMLRRLVMHIRSMSVPKISTTATINSGGYLGEPNTG